MYETVDRSLKETRKNEKPFLCITDDDFKRSSAFAFLDSIETKFNTQYAGRNASTTVPLALNNELAPIFAAEMKKFNLIEDQNKLMPVEEGDYSVILNYFIFCKVF